MKFAALALASAFSLVSANDCSADVTSRLDCGELASTEDSCSGEIAAPAPSFQP